jgi:hypothetical protein
MIKVCVNPHCSEVAHHCEKAETRCRNCDMQLVAIDQETYLKKFADYFFQYDYQTGDRVSAPALGYPVQLSIF